MTDESVDEKCCECDRPATVPFSGYPRCMKHHLVYLYAGYPRRSSAGNISDGEIMRWMKSKLEKVIEEMGTLMRADLDALAEKWNPSLDDSTEPDRSATP